MVTTISALPTVPSRAERPATFSPEADAFWGALPQFRTELNQLAADLVAFTSGLDFNGTSSSSVAIGTGSKTFNVPAGKLWFSGQPIIVVDAVTPTNYMAGIVSTYSGTTLVITAADAVGSGTKTSWIIGPIPVGGVTPGSVTTFTNKTINLASNTLTMTLAQLNAAVSDADLAAAGWTQIGSPVSMSGAAITLASLPQNYSSLLLLFDAISLDQAGTFFLSGSTDPTGASGFTGTSISYGSISSAANTATGAISIVGHSQKGSCWRGGVVQGSVPQQGYDSGGCFGLSGPLQSLKLTCTTGTGTVHDAGTVTVLARG